MMVSTHDVRLDAEYTRWILDVKQRYRGAQAKAAVKINSEQLLFNWSLGRDLVIRKAEERWGSGIVEQVSLDLQSEFPDARGFSARNLWYMKQWYTFYASESDAYGQIEALESRLDLGSRKLQQVAAVIDERASQTILQRAIAEIGQDGKPQQPIAGTPFPPVFGFVPWGHHIDITSKCHSVDEALFYVRKTIEEGLSRSALVNCIEANVYQTECSALTNFSKQLPTAQGKLAQEIVKDTYDLGFITLPPEYDERALENALEQNITRFLLELGTGFAFIGRQKEIVVSGRTRKIDMLFYHIRLRCYVVVELKTTSFEPEFTGKLNFYVNAVDNLMRADDDNPTIGLLICKDRDRTEVQWAFEGIQTPMGVATYGNVTIEEVRAQLPTDEQIQQRIEQAETEFKLNMEANAGR